MNLNLDRRTWASHRFDEFALNVTDRVDDPSAAGVDRYVGLEHLDSGSMTVNRWGTPDQVEAQKLRFQPGDVIFGRRRAYQKKVSRADFEGICSAHALVLRAKPEVIHPDFLPVFLSSDYFLDRAVSISVGSLSPTVNWRDLARQRFDLPPLDQQQHIADLLWSVEQHRERSVRAVRCLTTTKDVLADDIAQQYSERASIQELGCPDGQPVQVGPFGGSLASKHFRDSGVRVLKIQNITGTSEIDLAYSVFVSTEHARSLARYRVRVGDTLVVAQGATVGKTAMVNESIQDALISQHLIRVRLDPKRVLPAFGALMIRTGDFQNQINTVRAKTTRDGLNTEDVARFEIPVVDLTTQRSFLERVDLIDRTIRARSAELAALATFRRAFHHAILGGSV